MAESRDPFIILPETEEADRLIDRADALLKRHRTSDDDLPVLTEAVDDDIPLLTGSIDESAPPAPPAVDPAQLQARMVEQLVGLDALIQQRIDRWLAAELPQIFENEFEEARQRILQQVRGRAHATLLADISHDISELLDANGSSKP